VKKTLIGENEYPFKAKFLVPKENDYFRHFIIGLIILPLAALIFLNIPGIVKRENSEWISEKSVIMQMKEIKKPKQFKYNNIIRIQHRETLKSFVKKD
jgi:hypothetical protein